ncbi:MAG: alpha/beta hydrolase [Nocardia sp.]|nr:alpha/beta hydrolase [Nocardia sp.]
MQTFTLNTPEVDLVYDVHGPARPGGDRPLLMIGQPMTAEYFATLASYLPERTVITYDPRGLGRSVRKDGRTENRPQTQAEDIHALITEFGTPVDMFASSGGAVTALALVSAHPDDITTLVAHEPPLLDVLPDADAATRAFDEVRNAYQAKGFGAGMAAFLAMAFSWEGEFTDEYFARPLPDPAQFGLPAEDDGSRDDPLLSDNSATVPAYHPDIAALIAARTRVLIAVGEESYNVLTGRTAAATASLLGQEVTVFPSNHGGFVEGQGQPEAFANRLREVLTAAG